MKRIPIFSLLGLLCLSLTGCSGDTAQASPEVTKQFKGGPMPPDAQKKFQESMKKSHDLSQQRVPNGGKQ